MTGKPPAYGGVVVDADGRVLLREPTNYYGRYVWTFPKGHPHGDETPETAARRETLEETGWSAEIVDRIPGTFRGDTTDTIFFLMRPTTRVGEPDPNETHRVRWATLDEARELICETETPVGRKRDLAVLGAALALNLGCAGLGGE